MRFGRLVLVHLSLSILLLTVVIGKVSAAPGTDTLVGYWKLDETTQGSVTDSSGSSNTGTPQGSGGGPSPSTDVPTTTFSDVRSFSFNGSDQYFNCGNTPSNLPTGSGARTIAAWIKGNSFASAKTVAGWGNDSSGVLSELEISSSAKTEFHGNGNDIFGSTSLSTGQWYHVATTVTSGGAVKIYVNGTQDGTGSVSLNTTEANCKIGRQPDFNGQYFNGLIDDVRIYSRVLSPTEISDLAAGKPTSATWSGTTSSDFETGSNWDISAIPDPYTNLIFPSTTNHLILTSNAQAASATINSGAVVDLGGFSLTFNDSGSLTNNGSLYTNGPPVSNSNSSSSVLPPPGLNTYSCTDTAPLNAPDLFKVDTAGTYANLYFVTVKGATGYNFNYGTSAGANQYGDMLKYSGFSWILGRTVSMLSPNTTYYFRVQATNGCTGGPWSKTIQIKTKNKSSNITQWFANLSKS